MCNATGTPKPTWVLHWKGLQALALSIEMEETNKQTNKQKQRQKQQQKKQEKLTAVHGSFFETDAVYSFRPTPKTLLSLKLVRNFHSHLSVIFPSPRPPFAAAPSPRVALASALLLFAFDEFDLPFLHLCHAYICCSKSGFWDRARLLHWIFLHFGFTNILCINTCVFVFVIVVF